MTTTEKFLKTRGETSTSFEISPKLRSTEYLHTSRLIYFTSASMIIFFSVLIYLANDFSKTIVFLPFIFLLLLLPFAVQKMRPSYYRIIIDSAGVTFSTIKEVVGNNYRYEDFDEIEVLRTTVGLRYRPECRILLKKKNKDKAIDIILDQSFQTWTDSYQEAKLFKEIQEEMLFYGFEKSVVVTPEKWLA